jgi:hypothetical protein
MSGKYFGVNGFKVRNLQKLFCLVLKYVYGF